MNMQLLNDVLTCYGASGHEGRVRGVIEEALRGCADSLITDAMGNLIAVKNGDGTGKKIMLSAHMDHIGLAVIDADENGFLRVCNVGGVRAGNMISGHVVFENGVKGVVGVDGKLEKAAEVSDLYIDIGAENREEALSMVRIGDVCVMQPRVSMLGKNRMAGAAMDDRIACFVLLETMLGLEKGANDVYAVFSVQEEVGLRGAQTAAYAINPELGIAVDVTGVGDVPKADAKIAVSLGKGAAVKIMDRSLIATPAVVEMMENRAKERNIPVQREVLPYGGTDGGAIQRSRCGVPTGVISIPCRYIHSEAETVDLRDVKAAIDLLTACISG
ncbi:MAG: M42 family metallopeptidase [Clostridia bacterium]|nr:M42 family metallopeptidase [Clostridia bacterium]